MMGGYLRLYLIERYGGWLIRFHTIPFSVFQPKFFSSVLIFLFYEIIEFHHENTLHVRASLALYEIQCPAPLILKLN